MLTMPIVEIILYVLFTLNVVYLLCFSILSLFNVRKKKNVDLKCRNIAILIPAYKEDAVILECVHSCLKQKYPTELFDIVVIADRMQKETMDTLSSMPVKLVEVFFENSTKAKALNFAMESIGDYDIALILDADNTINEDFLSRINTAFTDPAIEIVQAHRMAKNTNTNMALLDAVSEEINNSIFRKGHVNAGLSAALIGSGMAFNYSLFKQVMQSIDAVGGFDRALELTLLYDGKKIGYLADANVYDEKVQYQKDFSSQRRRWMSAQVHYFNRFFKCLPDALKQGKWDFCDKLFQQMSIPRLILLGFTFILAVLFSFCDLNIALRWWGLYLALTLSLLLAIPKKLYTWRLLLAVCELPYTFCLMFLNLFRLKGANKKFIHTPHGVK